MSSNPHFGEEPNTAHWDEVSAPAALIVDIDGYEGPLDILLTLARSQQVDLKQVSVGQLAQQYLAFMAAASHAQFHLAAEYLVMAAWLAYLKSLLLLPSAEEREEPVAEALAEALTTRLSRLQAIREVGERLMSRPRLGQHFFPRGCPDQTETRWVPAPLAIDDLVRTYADVTRRRSRVQALTIETTELASVEEALLRIRRCLGRAPSWASLMRFLPPKTLSELRDGRLPARSQLAATFVAGLELARQGALLMRQMRPFGPIYVKAVNQEAPVADERGA